MCTTRNFAAVTEIACDVTALQDAVTAANSNGIDDVLSLGADCTYDLTQTLTVTSDSSHSLTIEGNGATIRQTCAGERVIHHLGDWSCRNRILAHLFALRAVEVERLHANQIDEALEIRLGADRQ